MNRNVGVVCIVVILAAVCFVTADYFALFGTRENPEYVLREIRLRLSDKLDNSLIAGAKARCFQKENKNACTQRDSGKPGIVSVKVPATRIRTKSLLFEHGHRYLTSTDPYLQVMLIHVDYTTQVTSIDINKHFANPAKVYQVTMQSRGPTATDDG